MHDWSLICISYDWKSRKLILDFRTDAGNASLEAQGTSLLLVPHRQEWGPSVNVQKCDGLESALQSGGKLELQMQSGDTIVIEAVTFLLRKEA
jgi:hypothetical protein